MEPFLLAGVALAGWLVPKSVHSFRGMVRNARGERDKEKAKVHLLHAMESRMQAVEKNQSLMVDRLSGISKRMGDYTERLNEVNLAGEQALEHSHELAKILEGHVQQCKEAYRTMGDISARAERTAIQAKERVESDGKSWQALDERVQAMDSWRESLQDGVSSLADEVAARLDTLGRRIEELPTEAENVAGMAEALRAMHDWRLQEAAPKLAALGEALMLLPAIQEQTAVLSESNNQMRSVLVDVADKVEVIESIVGRLPGPEPRTPMGPPPAGRSTDELAELMQQRSALQQTFLQRAAARGLPIQPPSRP
jgi:chromosome segregation ATPase